jgi:protein-tyrosine phosphatase
MTWESQSSLIIMLTTIVERGRVKCHQYWPNLGETAEFGRLSVTCVKDDSSAGSFAFRDFVVQEMDTNEIRHITQMAYLSWPDHGVPESNEEFVDFVEKVRTCRQGYSLCPTVVHCSAGIGRTGVLILMESALYLIEANQPVYPLELTRIMRDQRASMIQTPAQYRFVCQAILNVFHEGQIKPLPEFASSSSPAQSVKSSDSCSKTNITCKSVISASSSTSNHSDVEKDTNEVISNDESSDNKVVVSDKNSDIGIPTTVVDFEPHHTSLDVLPVVLGQIEDSSPRPESPVSSQESSSAAAPLSTAS